MRGALRRLGGAERAGWKRNGGAIGITDRIDDLPTAVLDCAVEGGVVLAKDRGQRLWRPCPEPGAPGDFGKPGGRWAVAIGVSQLTPTMGADGTHKAGARGAAPALVYARGRGLGAWIEVRDLEIAGDREDADDDDDDQDEDAEEKERLDHLAETFAAHLALGGLTCICPGPRADQADQLQEQNKPQEHPSPLMIAAAFRDKAESADAPVNVRDSGYVVQKARH